MNDAVRAVPDRELRCFEYPSRALAISKCLSTTQHGVLETVPVNAQDFPHIAPRWISHQLYRLRKKVAAGADLDGEVVMLKYRLGFDHAGSPKPLARIAIARVAREDASAPEPVELAPGLYELPWLRAAA